MRGMPSKQRVIGGYFRTYMLDMWGTLPRTCDSVSQDLGNLRRFHPMKGLGWTPLRSCAILVLAAGAGGFQAVFRVTW